MTQVIHISGAYWISYCCKVLIIYRPSVNCWSALILTTNRDGNIIQYGQRWRLFTFQYTKSCYRFVWYKFSTNFNYKSFAIWKCFISQSLSESYHFNTLRPIQNGRCFADDTFKRVFMNKKLCILIRISMKFVFKGPIDNKSSLI